MKHIQVEIKDISEPTTEMLALCILIRKQAFENFKQNFFTENRRYIYTLLRLCFDEYKIVDKELARVVHMREQERLIMEVNATFLTDGESIMSVSFSEVDSLFASASAMSIDDGTIGAIGAALAKLDEHRVYVDTLEKMYRNASKGIFDPYDDIVELERFTGNVGYYAPNFVQAFETYKTEEPAVPVMTGIRQLDDKAAILKGNVVSIGGDTGSLKTTSALWLVIKILQNNPTMTALFFEKEMPISDVINKIISWTLETDIKDVLYDNERCVRQMDEVLSGTHPRSEFVLSILKRLKLVSCNDFNTIEDVVNYVQAMKPDIWVLDYLTQMFQSGGKASDHLMLINSGVGKIKSAVQRTKSIAIIINQLNKNTVELRPTMKVPLMDDIEWGGEVKKLSNCVLMTYYPRLYFEDAMAPSDLNNFYLVNRKNRFQEGFKIALTANAATNTFIEERIAVMDQQQYWLKDHMQKASKFK